VPTEQESRILEGYEKRRVKRASPVAFLSLSAYLVSERKLGIFSKVKEGENYNHRNTFSISRIII
jgi:hypothetical protein